MSFYIFHRHRVCLVDCVDLIFSLYSWWEGFESSSLATLPLSFDVVLFLPLHVGRPLRLPWRTWVCPCEGQVWRWCSCLGCRGSGSTRYSGVLAAMAAGNSSILEGYGNKYWPMHSSILAWRKPLTQKPGRPQSTGLERVGHDRSNPGSIDTRFFFVACGSSA